MTYVEIFQLAITIIVPVITLLVFYWQFQSFPPSTQSVIDTLVEAAAKTPTSVDDDLAQLAKMLYDLIQQQELPTDPPPTEELVAES